MQLLGGAGKVRLWLACGAQTSLSGLQDFLSPADNLEYDKPSHLRFIAIEFTSFPQSTSPASHLAQTAT